MSGTLLSSGLHRGLQELAGLQARPMGSWAADLDAAVQDLLRPTAVLGAHPSAPTDPLPALATLPPSAHLNLLLLLRAAPHRFTAAQRAALLDGLQRTAAASPSSSDPQHGSLVQVLAAEAQGGVQGWPASAAVPACPSFLYSAQPCFPWAPVLTDTATATALHKRQLKEARRREQERLQAQQGAATAAAAGGKRPAEHGQPDEDEAGAAKRQRGAAPPSTAGTTASTAAAAEADAELEAAVAAMAAALAAHAAGSAGELASVPPQLRAALDVLLVHAAAGTAAGEEALQASGLSSLTDDSLLLLLLSDLVSPASSFARCRAAAAGLLRPRLAALAGPAPRDLAVAAQHVGSANPQAFIAACLRPLLSAPGLNKHQAELLTTVVKASLPPALLPEVLAAACAPAEGAPAAAGGAAWNEHTVGVLQAALNTKPPLSGGAVAQVAGACAAAATASSELAGNAKLAKLLLSLVKQYPAEAAAAKRQLQAAAQATQSFMSKSLLAAVAKL